MLREPSRASPGWIVPPAIVSTEFPAAALWTCQCSRKIRGAGVVIRGHPPRLLAPHQIPGLELPVEKLLRTLPSGAEDVVLAEKMDITRIDIQFVILL